MYKHNDTELKRYYNQTIFAKPWCNESSVIGEILEMFNLNVLLQFVGMEQ